MKAGDFPSPGARSGIDADQASADGRQKPNFPRSQSVTGASAFSTSSTNPPLSSLGLAGGDALGSLLSKKALPRSPSDSSLTGGRRRREIPIPESKFRSGSVASAATSQQGDDADAIGDMLGLGGDASG